MKEDIENLINKIRVKYATLPAGSCAERDYLAHIKSIAIDGYSASNYPTHNIIEFPNKLIVSYAVCSIECGIKEYIIEGSTQECQHCGGLMYRTNTAEYKYVKEIIQQ